MKVCSNCKLSKRLSEFYSARYGKDKHESRCKVCHNKASKLNSFKRRHTLKGYLSYLCFACRGRAKEAGIIFKLTPTMLENKFITQQGLCAISSVPMTRIVGEVGKHFRAHTNISVDRIDPALGYVEDNIQLVCYVINVMKYTLSLDELRDWCRKIISDTTH